MHLFTPSTPALCTRGSWACAHKHTNTWAFLDLFPQPRAGRTEVGSSSSYKQNSARFAQGHHEQMGSTGRCGAGSSMPGAGQHRGQLLLAACCIQGLLFAQRFTPMFLSHPLLLMWNTSSMHLLHFHCKFTAYPLVQKAVNGFTSFFSCPQRLTSL